MKRRDYLKAMLRARAGRPSAQCRRPQPRGIPSYWR